MPCNNKQCQHDYNSLLKQSIWALLQCLEARDAYTFGHSMRVMQYALLIARGAQLSPSEMQVVEWAAVFHDIGKIGVSDCVLRKESRLNSEERQEIRSHPKFGFEVINLIEPLKQAAIGILHHHERIDGKGYPSGTKFIPLASRVILVADTFDAMTSTRPYRNALPIETAYEELERYSGKQFDHDLVQIFIRAHQTLYEQSFEVPESNEVDIVKKQAA